ncbi:MAG TPA: UDP-N-acetylmuramoyl-tripeptide--D-alanyl-D-alanine ligase, partial [Daejeonella sp.]|nr:UDP-N-acetylmuramoyl-tripeptide--D-alanyl-D-alanine ligase [Daejeonella sp.]
MNVESLYQQYLQSSAVCTDTRQVTPDCIFFALKGDNFDGNAFALKALEAGAKWAVVDDPSVITDDRFILTDNVLNALQDLARHHRRQLSIPFIAITGTNGKTTTKELLYSVLSQHCKTHATAGNLNNHIGVPLTILAIPASTEIAIIEMGANHQKEIALLCHIAEPTHGLITNVGKAHLEGFGSFEGVKIAKGELYEYLAQNNGIAFINSDNRHLVDMSRDRKVQNIVHYGSTADNYVSGALTEASPFLSVAWHREALEVDDQTHIAKSNLTGAYNLENILAAICIGSFFRLSADQINRGIEIYHPANNRSQLTKTDKNILICDFYNANPSSMKVALDNLKSAGEKQKAFILGDMFELGKEAAAEHQLVVEEAMSVKAQRSIFVGEEFYKLKDTAHSNA